MGAFRFLGTFTTLVIGLCFSEATIDKRGYHVVDPPRVHNSYSHNTLVRSPTFQPIPRSQPPRNPAIFPVLTREQRIQTQERVEPIPDLRSFPLASPTVPQGTQTLEPATAPGTTLSANPTQSSSVPAPTPLPVQSVPQAVQSSDSRFIPAQTPLEGGHRIISQPYSHGGNVRHEPVKSVGFIPVRQIHHHPGYSKGHGSAPPPGDNIAINIPVNVPPMNPAPPADPPVPLLIPIMIPASQQVDPVTLQLLTLLMNTVSQNTPPASNPAPNPPPMSPTAASPSAAAAETGGTSSGEAGGSSD